MRQLNVSFDFLLSLYRQAELNKYWFPKQLIVVLLICLPLSSCPLSCFHVCTSLVNSIWRMIHDIVPESWIKIFHFLTHAIVVVCKYFIWHQNPTNNITLMQLWLCFGVITSWKWIQHPWHLIGQMDRNYLMVIDQEHCKIYFLLEPIE